VETRRREATTRSGDWPGSPRAATGRRRAHSDGHATNPPARYTEASLIKALEELGMAARRRTRRSSDHPGPRLRAKKGQRPGAVVGRLRGHRLLEQHFGRLVDYDFTAAMEDELDAIASGNEQRTNWLNNFYFGGDHGVPDSWPARGLKKLVGVNLEGIDAEKSTPSSCLTIPKVAWSMFGRQERAYLERTNHGDDGEPTPQRANLKTR